MTSVAESHRKTSVDKGVLREGQCQRDVHNRPFSVLTGTFPANTTFVALYFSFFLFLLSSATFISGGWRRERLGHI